MPNDDKVVIEVLRGAARDPVLAINDTRVSGPKCGPYDVITTFRVERPAVLAALGLPEAPAAKDGPTAEVLAMELTLLCRSFATAANVMGVPLEARQRLQHELDALVAYAAPLVPAGEEWRDTTPSSARFAASGRPPVDWKPCPSCGALAMPAQLKGR